MVEGTTKPYRLSISNVSWPAKNEDEALSLLAELHVEGVEVAPAKVFGDLFKVASADLRAYRRRLVCQGLCIPALQGILFGAKDAYLFRSEGSRRTMALHLARVAEIASELRASACVFGAPTLRDPGELQPATAQRIAVDFFGKLAEVFASRGLALCFEANPSLYNCRFITGTPEALGLVETIDHPGLALQLDTGTIFANGEDAEIITKGAERIGHCHVSEPSLVPIGTSGLDHTPVAAALRASKYRGWISIEMKAGSNWKTALVQAHKFVVRSYFN